MSEPRATPFRLVHDADPHGQGIRDFPTAVHRDQMARELARVTGGTVYTFRWCPTPQSLALDDGWMPEAHIEPGLDDGDYITISLTVVNTYEWYASVTTTFDNVRIPAPPDDDDAYDEWRYTHIDAFTGVGNDKGHSWHDVTVTACSDPSLVGRQFSFGY